MRLLSQILEDALEATTEDALKLLTLEVMAREKESASRVAFTTIHLCRISLYPVRYGYETPDGLIVEDFKTDVAKTVFHNDLREMIQKNIDHVRAKEVLMLS